MNPLEQKLTKEGWSIGKDGRWSKRRVLGRMEAARPEPATVRPLVKRVQKQPSRQSCVVCRVSLVAMRRRLLDPDAVAAACKPLTDAIARTVGIDDADPACEWEWTQVRTLGAEGVVVKIEML